MNPNKEDKDTTTTAMEITETDMKIRSTTMITSKM